MLTIKRNQIFKPKTLGGHTISKKNFCSQLNLNNTNQFFNPKNWFVFFDELFQSYKEKLFASALFIAFQERKRQLTDAFTVSTLFLIFIKFLSIEFTGFYPMILLNISLLFFMLIIAYYYDIMIKIKTLIVYYYHNPYILDRKYLAIYAIMDQDERHPEPHWSYFSEYKNKKRYLPTQYFFYFFHILLFQLRLIFLAEPYIFIFIRMFILYLLVFNKLFLFAAIISIIGIFSRILFHLTFWDMSDVKRLYEFLTWDPLFWLKSYDENDSIILMPKENNNIILKPTWNNAKILYALSLLGLLTEKGTLGAGLTTWRMHTVYNYNIEVQKADKAHHLTMRELYKERGEYPPPRCRDTVKYYKPFFNEFLTDNEDNLHVYLVFWGIKFNFEPFYIGEGANFTQDEGADETYDNIPDNFLTPYGEINYIMDGTYKKNHILWFILSLLVLIFGLGLIEYYWFDFTSSYPYMEFSAKNTIITFGNQLTKGVSTKGSNIHTLIKQAPIKQQEHDMKAHFRDIIPQEDLFEKHPFSLAIGLDSKSKCFYAVNITTYNPYKIHTRLGVTPILYNKQRQSIIGLFDTGFVIRPENPEYAVYLNIYNDVTKLSPDQTVSGLLNENKISPIGYEDKYEQELSRSNIPGYARWQRKSVSWKSSYAYFSPVPRDKI